MTSLSERTALFISHASPEDNAFVRWLGAKLTALGYEVWADIMRLRGGSDWSRDVEKALRQRTAKMLLVCTPLGLDKQGVRNEIGIAADLAQKLGDKEFIIPLRLERYEPPFQIAQAQHIDFMGGWQEGFAELAELLTQFPAIRQEPGRSMEIWLDAQRAGATKLIHKNEILISNWLEFLHFPKTVYYCEPPVGFSIESFQNRQLHHWPIVPFRSGVLTFAKPNQEKILEPEIPAKKAGEMEADQFLDQGWIGMEIPASEARRIFVDLGNQAMEDFLKSKNLSFSPSSSGRGWWFGDLKTVPLTQIRFNWDAHNGRRQIIGESGKRKTHWHYATSWQVRTVPVQHVRMSASLIFSDNGMDAVQDHKKAHRLRRSFAKSWRNSRWRDMMLAFLWWLSDGKNTLTIPVAREQSILLLLPPAAFTSPVSVLQDGDEPPDEDDPDIDDAEWDEYLELPEEEEN